MKKVILGLIITLCLFVFFTKYLDKITGLFAKEETIEESLPVEGKEMTQLIAERLCSAKPGSLTHLLVLLNDTENIRRTNPNLAKFVMMAEVPDNKLTYNSEINWCNLGKEEIIENYGIFVLQTNYMIFRSDMDEKTAYGFAVIDLFDKALIGGDKDKRKELAVKLAKIGYSKNMDDYIGFLSETLGPKLGEILFNELTEEQKDLMVTTLLMAVGYLK